MKIHTVEKPNLCNQCRKSFLQDNKLKMYFEAHSVEKAYKYSQYEAFSQHIILKDQNITHH